MQIGRRLSILAGLIFLIPVLGLTAPAAAQQAGGGEIPKILLSGFDAYKAAGAEAAIKAWLKGSAIEGSKEALSQANNLRQIEDFYGRYKSFHLLRVRKLTPTTQVLYMTIDYEKGPVFAKFTVYKTDADWILVSFLFNAREDAILPSCGS